MDSTLEIDQQNKRVKYTSTKFCKSCVIGQCSVQMTIMPYINKDLTRFRLVDMNVYLVPSHAKEVGINSLIVDCQHMNLTNLINLSRHLIVIQNITQGDSQFYKKLKNIITKKNRR